MWPDIRVQQRDYLLEILRALTAKLDLSEVLRMILEAAVEMLGQADGDGKPLERYTREWNSSTGRVNEIYFRAAKVFYRLSDRQLDRALDRLSKVPDLIDETGMDARRVFRTLLRSNPLPFTKIALSILFGGRKGTAAGRRSP